MLGGHPETLDCLMGLLSELGLLSPCLVLAIY